MSPPGPTAGLSPQGLSLTSGGSSSTNLTITTVSSTPTGSYDVSVNAVSGAVSHIVHISLIVMVDHPPTLTVPGPQVAIAGSALQFTVSAIDVDVGEAVTITASGLPSGASFDGASGQFSWTPSTSQIGTYNVTFTAVDNGSPQMSDNKSVPIVVQVAQPPPPSTQQPSGQGTCLWCQVTHVASTNTWLLIAGILAGFMATLTVVYLRVRSRLAEAQRMRLLTLGLAYPALVSPLRLE